MFHWISQINHCQCCPFLRQLRLWPGTNNRSWVIAAILITHNYPSCPSKKTQFLKSFNFALEWNPKKVIDHVPPELTESFDAWKNLLLWLCHLWHILSRGRKKFDTLIFFWINKGYLCFIWPTLDTLKSEMHVFYLIE